MTEPWPPPCIHSPDGRTLCADCQFEYDTDPSAYIDFGEHPTGIENWTRELELIEASAREAQANRHEADPNLPF